MKAIMITGVAGVGKSTLVKSVAETLHLPHADYADYMIEVMQSGDKDAIQRLSSTDRAAVVTQVRCLLEHRLIFDRNDLSYLLLENHLSVIVNGVIETPPPEIYWRFNLAALCVVTAEPAEVLSRRLLDRTRQRYLGNLDQIAEQQAANFIAAKAISEQYRVPLLTIDGSRVSALLPALTEWVQMLTVSSPPRQTCS